MLPYKAGTYVHNMNNNRHDLLTLHIRLVRAFMTQTITSMFYWSIPYFSCIVQMDDTDDRTKLLRRHRRELNRLNRLLMERETPEEV